MSAENTFFEFPKMGRLSREVIVTEKIDGTNAQVFVWDSMKAQPGDDPLQCAIHEPPGGVPWIWSDEGISIAAGSRTRWITPTDDNFGFARWVADRAEVLAQLGHGRHYGEWWGSGIQRGYGLTKGDKRFSLFNVSRWCLHGEIPKRIPQADPRVEKYQDVLPEGVGLVPVLGRGIGFDGVDNILADLALHGSYAAPGFMKPEGIVAFHTAANVGFKKTLNGDAAKGPQ